MPAKDGSEEVSTEAARPGKPAKPPGTNTWMTFVRQLRKETAEEEAAEKKALVEILKAQQEEAAKERRRWQVIALVIILGGLSAAGVGSAVKFGGLDLTLTPKASDPVVPVKVEAPKD